jgi:hypothetical protein
MYDGVMLSDGEGQLQPAVGQLGNISGDEMNLRQDGLTGEHLGWKPLAFPHRAYVILIVPVEDGDQRPGVGEDALHRP